MEFRRGIVARRRRAAAARLPIVRAPSQADRSGDSMKKIGKSDIIGQKGMSLIEGVVLSMGFMFYPTGGVEAGIDGYIELRDEETEEVGNLLLQVQGKATERERLQGDTEDSFEYTCSDADIAYWTQGTAPVLLIVVALKQGKGLLEILKGVVRRTRTAQVKKGRLRQGQGRVQPCFEGRTHLRRDGGSARRIGTERPEERTDPFEPP
jgi:hypothetical protein